MPAPTDSIEISALTAVVTAAGTDIFPVVQSGVNKRETNSQLLTYIEGAIGTAAFRALINDASTAALRATLELAGLPTLIVASSTYSASAYADYRCDGTADDVQIQAAIDALGATGGTVHLTAGTYTVAAAGSVSGDTLTTPYCILIDASDGPIRLVGQGIGATTITEANTQASNTIPLLLRGSSASPRTNPTLIEGITFDGNGANQTAWTDFGIVTVAYARNVVFDRCEFTDAAFSSCLIFRNSLDAVLTRCVCRLPSGFIGEMRIENPRVRVLGNIFYGDDTNVVSGASCLSLNNNTDVSIMAEGVTVQGNEFTGGPIALALGGTSRNVITGNVFRDVTTTGGAAIAMTHNSQGAGFDCYNNLILGNTFYNIRRAVRLSGSASNGCKRNTIAYNVIEFGPDVSLGEGILESSAAGTDYNEFDYNLIVGATTAISMSGTNSKRRGNRVFNTSSVFVSQDAITDLSTADVTGNLPVANLNSGTSASSSTFWRGDATWATPSTSAVAEGRAKVGGTPNYSIPGVDVVSVATKALTANRIYYAPVYVASQITLDQLAIEVTAFAGSVARLAIYNADTDWQPTTRVLDAGTVATTANAGVTASISQVLTAGRYLFAIIADSAVTLRTWRGGSRYLGLVPALGASSTVAQLFVAGSGTTLPDPGTAWATASGGTLPLDNMVICRVSTP